MDDPRSKIVPAAPGLREASTAPTRPATRRTVHSPAPHARASSAPRATPGAAVLRATEPRAPRLDAHSPLPPPPLPPGQRPEAVLLAGARPDLAEGAPPTLAVAPGELAEASDPSEASVADEPTRDLPPPPAALRVALNRPISLADVRAVRTEQSAIASESTYVGPPE
jgi:hypothetical protein